MVDHETLHEMWTTTRAILVLLVARKNPPGPYIIPWSLSHALVFITGQGRVRRPQPADHSPKWRTRSTFIVCGPSNRPWYISWLNHPRINNYRLRIMTYLTVCGPCGGPLWGSCWPSFDLSEVILVLFSMCWTPKLCRITPKLHSFCQLSIVT